MNTGACSFCGRSRQEVSKLIAGRNAFICDSCVTLCTELLQEGDCDAERTESTFDRSRLGNVRSRPEAYVGELADGTGIHNLVVAVVDSALHEVAEGFGDTIAVVIHRDGSVTVEDQGRGIPVDLHPASRRPASEVVLTTFRGGLSVVNALSEWLEIKICRDGQAYAQEYRRGEPTTKLTAVGVAGGTGTRITFKPDPAIFGSGELSLDAIARRVRESAPAAVKTRVVLSDERSGHSRELRLGYADDWATAVFEALSDTLALPPRLRERIPTLTAKATVAVEVLDLSKARALLGATGLREIEVMDDELAVFRSQDGFVAILWCKRS